MKLKGLLFGLLLSLVLAVSCAAPVATPSAPAITFEQVGKKGYTIFLVLTSQGVTDDALANKLRNDWQSMNIVEVNVFDNKEAPARWLELWPRLATMTDAEWAKEQAQIFPHWIAQYSKNKNTGLNEVYILSKDSAGKSVKVIKFKSERRE